MRQAVLGFFALLVLLSSSTAANAYSVYGLIAKKWVETGGSIGPLGNPTSDERDDGFGGRINTFEHGYIVWVPGWSGAAAIYGELAKSWWDHWGNVSLHSLGRPIDDELDWHGARRIDLERGILVWNPGKCIEDRAVCGLYGTIASEWLRTFHFLYALPNIGNPVSNERDCIAGASRVQKFDGGYIFWEKATGNACIKHTRPYGDEVECSARMKKNNCPNL